MTRGRKRVPSSQQIPQDLKLLRKSSSADALNVQADESFQSADLDISASQPVRVLPSTSGGSNGHQSNSANINKDIRAVTVTRLLPQDPHIRRAETYGM